SLSVFPTYSLLLLLSTPPVSVFNPTSLSFSLPVCLSPSLSLSLHQDGVFRMSLSPDGALLAVVHFSGRLSLWDIPSFKLRASWEQSQQVCVCVCVCQSVFICVCVCVCVCVC